MSPLVTAAPPGGRAPSRRRDAASRSRTPGPVSGAFRSEAPTAGRRADGRARARFARQAVYRDPPGPMRVLLRILWWSGVAMVVAVGLLVFWLHGPLPTAAELTGLLEQNRSAYEQRTEEIRQAVNRGQRFAPLQDDALGYFTFDARREPFRVLYYTSRSGLGVGAYGTGLAYLEEPPERLYSGIEAMREAARAVEGFIGFGGIEGDWYYFFWEAD